MTGDQLALKKRFSRPSGWLYLGGVPDEIANINLPDVGFIGCMFKLKVRNSRDLNQPKSGF